MPNKNRGRPLDPIHRQHISESLKGNKICLGRKMNEETKIKIGTAHKGMKHSEATKAIIREKRKLQVCTPETRAKMSAARQGSKNPMFGKKLSEEQRKRLSNINAGKNHPQFGTHQSEDTKRKISEANSKQNYYNFGGTLTDEHRQKISIGITGEKNPNWIGGSTDYCRIFRSGTFRHRVRAFWENVCQLCGKPAHENESLDVHHVYYNKKACCDINSDGKYYTDLGIKGAQKDFEIVGDPSKFIPFHHECHSMTTPKKVRVYFARKFEKQINEDQNGKCYFTEDEYKEIVNSTIPTKL